MRRIRRIVRPIDAKLILALTALIVTVTVCYGFVQRGDHITSAERSIEDLTEQVDRLLDENTSLRDQLTRIERRSARREKAAAHDREVLSRELLRLTEWLRANGIAIPSRAGASTSGGRVSPIASPPQAGSGSGGGAAAGPGAGGPGPQGGSGDGEPSPGSSDGAAVHVGPDGVSIDLPGDLPDVRLP